MLPPSPDRATERAGEIIAAYGADVRRWPDGERAAALACVAGDPGLRADLAAAAVLDADLADWARRDAGVLDGVAPVRVAAPRYRAWLGGGLAAAAVAASLVWLAPLPGGASAPAAVVARPVAAVAAAADGADGFAYVFTPTQDEESLI